MNNTMNYIRILYCVVFHNRILVFTYYYMVYHDNQDIYIDTGTAYQKNHHNYLRVNT